MLAIRSSTSIFQSVMSYANSDLSLKEKEKKNGTNPLTKVGPPSQPLAWVYHTYPVPPPLLVRPTYAPQKHVLEKTYPIYKNYF